MPVAADGSAPRGPGRRSRRAAPPASPWDHLADADAFGVSYRRFLDAYAPLGAAGAPAVVAVGDAADGVTTQPGPSPAAGRAVRGVAELEWRLFKEWTARLEESCTLVHAAVLGLRGRAVVLAGRTGSGKTTLALALLARGWTFLSDDCAVLDGAASLRGAPLHVRVWPAPGAMHVKGGLSRSLARSLGGALAAVPYPAGFFPQAEEPALCCLVRPPLLAPPGRPWPVAAVVLPERRDGDAEGRDGDAARGHRPVLERLTPARALKELVFHSFARTPDRLGRDFRLLAALVRAVPSHRLLPADPDATAAILEPLVDGG